MTPDEAQRTFRAILDALAHPTRPFPIAGTEAPFSSGAAAVALTLCDEDTPVWLDATLADDGAIAAWFAFHTGAPVVADHTGAAFVFATGLDTLPPLADLAAGTPEEPHRSATVVLTTAIHGHPVTATGPGINGHAGFRAPAGFRDEWHHNTRRFPQGVDLLIVDGTTVTGLPRTTALEGAA